MKHPVRRRILSMAGLTALMVGALAGPAAGADSPDTGQICARLFPTGGPVEVARVVVSGYLQNGRHETDSFGLRQGALGTYEGCSGPGVWGKPDVWTGRVLLRLIVNANELGRVEVDAGSGRSILQAWSVEVPPLPPKQPEPTWIPCPPSC